MPTRSCFKKNITFSWTGWPRTPMAVVSSTSTKYLQFQMFKRQQNTHNPKDISILIFVDHVLNGEYLFLVPKKLFLAPNCWSAPKCLFDPNIWIWHLIASTQPKVARSSSWTPYLLFADSAPKPKHPAPILFHVCLPNSRNLPDFMYPNNMNVAFGDVKCHFRQWR